MPVCRQPLAAGWKKRFPRSTGAAPGTRLPGAARARCPGGSAEAYNAPILGDLEPWSCGFRPPGFGHDHDWERLAPDVALARQLAESMQEYVLSSDADVPFFPFVGQLDRGYDSAEQELLAAIGLGAPLPRPVAVVDISTRSHFAWDAEEFDQDDPIEDYYGTNEIEAYAETTRVMRGRLTALRMAGFEALDMSRPIFWYGNSSPGSLVGLFSVRVDT